jgi:hypothetical protein
MMQNTSRKTSTNSHNGEKVHSLDNDCLVPSGEPIFHPAVYLTTDAILVYLVAVVDFVKSLGEIHDEHDLQEDLDKLTQWGEDWVMQFHPAKCTVLTVTNKRNPIVTECTIRGQLLAAVTSAMYTNLTALRCTLSIFLMPV